MDRQERRKTLGKSGDEAGSSALSVFAPISVFKAECGIEFERYHHLAAPFSVSIIEFGPGLVEDPHPFAHAVSLTVRSLRLLDLVTWLAPTTLAVLHHDTSESEAFIALERVRERLLFSELRIDTDQIRFAICQVRDHHPSGEAVIRDARIACQMAASGSGIATRNASHVKKKIKWRRAA